MINFSELPSGWSIKQIEELCIFNPKHDKEIKNDIEVSFVPMATVDEHAGIIKSQERKLLGEVRKGYTHFAEEDIIFAKITPCMENGKIAVAHNLINGLACGSTEFHVLRSYGEILPNYLLNFLRQQNYLNVAAGNMTGVVGQRRLPKEFLLATKVPVPPLNEQHRIVAKIEALKARSARVKESLSTIPALLDQFRQSVLAAAFRGDLTAEWRSQNPDVEPADVLLEKIRVERHQCWENHLLKQRKNPKKAKYQKSTDIEDNNLSGLPDSWCWITLGDVAWSVKDGPHFSPKYSESGIPFISGGNVRPDGIDFQNVKYISPELHEELSARCVPDVGDILYTKGGTTGIARVNTYTHPFNVWVHVAVLKCVPSIERFYLQHALNSPHCYKQSQEFTHGVGNQDLGLTRMVKITIPLPPLAEQKVIVNRVNQYMQTIKKLEKLVATVNEQTEYADQSILSQAFRGELVPQDPNDEPASVLLQRIRAEREKTLTPKAKRSKKTKPVEQPTQMELEL